MLRFAAIFAAVVAAAPWSSADAQTRIACKSAIAGVGYTSRGTSDADGPAIYSISLRNQSPTEVRVDLLASGLPTNVRPHPVSGMVMRAGETKQADFATAWNGSQLSYFTIVLVFDADPAPSGRPSIRISGCVRR